MPCQEAPLPIKPSNWPHHFIVLLGNLFICLIPILFTPFQEFSFCTLSNTFLLWSYTWHIHLPLQFHINVPQRLATIPSHLLPPHVNFLRSPLISLPHSCLLILLCDPLRLTSAVCVSVGLKWSTRIFRSCLISSITTHSDCFIFHSFYT